MDELLIKYVLGETTPNETARVREWVGASEENQRRLEQFRAIWQLSGETPVSGAPDKSAVWQRVRSKLSAEGETGAAAANGAGRNAPTLPVARTERPVIRLGRYGIGRVAAIVAGVLTLGTIVYALTLTKHPSTVTAVTSQQDTPKASRETLVMRTEAMKEDPKEKETTAIRKKADEGKKTDEWMTVAAGNVARVDSLPDGSVVRLSQQSSISYPKDFGNHRMIRLEGGAGFDVTHDPSHPFVVQIQDITIKVLGTSFDVVTLNDQTEVIMRSGVTRVIRGNDSVLLHWDEQVVARTGAKEFQDTVPGKKAPEDRVVMPMKKFKRIEKPREEMPMKKMEKMPAKGEWTKEKGEWAKEKGEWTKEKEGWVKEPRVSVSPKKIGRVPEKPRAPVTPKKKMAPVITQSVEESKRTVRNIIDQMIAEHIIPSRDSLVWFCLERSRFIVNDRPVDEEQTRRFQSIYLVSGAPNYYYGSVRVAGSGVFLSKEDIYP